MKIGYNNYTYNESRNIIGIIGGFKYIKISDKNFYSYFHAIQSKLFKKVIWTKHNRFFPIKKQNVDILHFWNTINYSNKPWVVTFESKLPRFNKINNNYFSRYHELKALKTLTLNNCLSLIAISEFTKQIQLNSVKKYPTIFESIKNKITVLHPPQQLLVDKNFKKQIGDTIHFIFVGSSFFRKGGREIFEVFNKLKDSKKFKLTIISSVTKDDYATKETNEDILLYKNKLLKSEWLDYYDYLPNSKVLELIKGADVGLLPTWADTYGYSVLEFQAAGCPVISTNVRALPEINNKETGWIINLPKDRNGEAFYSTFQERESIKEIIQTELEKIIVEILEDKKSIITKSIKSIERIKKEHSPYLFQEKLKKIYNKVH